MYKRRAINVKIVRSQP